MNEIMHLKKRLFQKRKELHQLKGKVERSLKKAPEGTLVVSSSNGNTQFFWKTGSEQKKGSYIEKDRKKLAYALAQKDYEQRLLKEIDKRIKRVGKIVEWLPDKGLEEIYEKLSPERKKLVTPYVLTDEQYVEKWRAVAYVGKDIPDDIPSFLTARGEIVRSKSEKIIADKLNSMGIPYRYEYPLKLQGYGIVYPDFTILDVSGRKEIYMEHLGMMDHPEYCEKAIAKLQNYASHGIFPGKSLLLTFETRNRPLNMEFVEQLLKEFFQEECFY